MKPIVIKCSQFSLSIIQNRNTITYNLFVDRALELEILSRLALGKPFKKRRDKIIALILESLEKIDQAEGFAMDNNYKMKIRHLFQFYINKTTSDFRNDVIPRFNTLQDYNGFLRAINEFMDKEI